MTSNKSYVLGAYVSMLPINIKNLVENEVIETIQSMELSNAETEQSIEVAMNSRLSDLENLIDLQYILENVN